MVTFLSHFTPSMMPEDVIERIFVQRKRLASRLVTLIRESVLGTAKHHTLIVGPRGIGKTHLASLVYHRIRGMPDLADKMRIAWLREEEWGIASFLDFVIRVLRALDEGYPEAGLAYKIDSLFTHKAEHAEREAVALLDEFVGARTVFLITENLDELFEGLNHVGQQQFRAYLQDRATWTILATAPGLFNGISLQSSPFYGFFRIHHLKELSVDEAVELLQKIAELRGRDELASYVRTPVGRARIRAVHHLAGGNHRIYVIFSEFLTRETLDDLVEPFLTTMDHLTPYYQARMQSLSPQMRKIVDFLCEVRHAVPVRDIAQRCFVTQQTASAQLKTLKERGFVRSFSVGRESHYELTEPLLRLSLEVKKQRGGPIRVFVDFLRYWYTKPELDQRLLTTCLTNPVDREYFHRVLQDWDAIPTVGEPHLREWYDKYKMHLREGNPNLALEFAESLVRMRGTFGDHLAKAACLGGMGDAEAALRSADEARALAPRSPAVMLMLGLIYRDLERPSDILTVLDDQSFEGELPAVGWNVRGFALHKLEREHDALAAFERAVELDPERVSYRVDYISSLLRFKRHEEAFAIAISHPKANQEHRLLTLQGVALTGLGRDEEALQVFRKAVQTEDTVLARAGLGAALISLEKYSEAETELERALELDPKNPAVWPTLRFLHLQRAVALAVSGEWKTSLSALHLTMNRFGGGADDATVGESLVRSWLLLRAREHWHEELSVIADIYAGQGLLPLLSSAVAKSQAGITSGNIDPSNIREWVSTWASISEAHPELEVGVRLLGAGAEYHISGDPRHLLELASEERAMVESIPGVRPLSALS